MKGIYLASFEAYHFGFDIDYQDINGKRDIPGDMMDIDLSPYDFIIATPPCNYWSRANYRRDFSEYSLNTRHLLPDILKKLVYQDKPFIVENVRSSRLFKLYGLYDLPCFIYEIGQHTYWSNILLPNDIFQVFQNKQNISRKLRQGGINVHNVIDTWLDIVHTLNGDSKKVFLFDD